MNNLSGCLGLLFVALKLTNQIGWPWIWATAPFWLPLVIALVFFLFALLIVIGERAFKK